LSGVIGCHLKDSFLIDRGCLVDTVYYMTRCPSRGTDD
jgi:hypothetical protein